MRSSWCAALFVLALALCAQPASADCGQCDQSWNQCSSDAGWDYYMCEGGCDDWSCSVDCRANYLMWLDFCDNEYDWCTATCDWSGGGDPGGGCNNVQTTCGVQCGDGSWSSIACNPREIASCACDGVEPQLQATPSCTPCSG